MSLNVYEIITDRIIQSLEKGLVPWKTPWRTSMPKNLISGKNYRGINIFLLNTCKFPSEWWLTYKQAQAKGGTVRKGEKGCPVIFWKIFKDDKSDKLTRPPILRYYTVFNLSQCDGIEAPVSEAAPSLAFHPIEACEHIVDGYTTCPAVEFGGNQAAYIPSRDVITMPTKTVFHHEEGYYATFMHELVHSTGHKSRLDRVGITNLEGFGTHSYSYEELVAECGSAFLCGEAGILNNTIDNSIAYIKGWVSKLRSEPKWVIKAGGESARAADYILGRGKQETTQEDE